MLRARANPSVGDDKEVTPLHLATFDGNLEMCKVLLVARASVDSCDRHGQTPLFFAPTKDRDLQDAGGEAVGPGGPQSQGGQSALHLAGRNGLSEVFAWLVACTSKRLSDLKEGHPRLHGAQLPAAVWRPRRPRRGRPAAAQPAARGEPPRGEPAGREPAGRCTEDPNLGALALRSAGCYARSDSAPPVAPLHR
ncbi:unnamed protein product, partial [Prorocentrum cordatum]